MNEIITTTTHDVEGFIITKYLGTVCSNIVIGANIFSDIAASFTDFFGGKSEAYQKKLNLLNDEVNKNLIMKAQKLGANAIVGYRIDFDDISGGGKSMFMVAASGTAVYIENKYCDKIELCKAINVLEVASQNGYLDPEDKQNMINSLQSINREFAQRQKINSMKFHVNDKVVDSNGRVMIIKEIRDEKYVCYINNGVTCVGVFEEQDIRGF